MKKVFTTVYKSFEAGFSVKITSNDTITNTKGNSFDAVKVVNDNFIINNPVYLSFENDQDFKLSVSFTPTTVYKVRQLFRKLVDAIPEMYTGEGATLAIAEKYDKQVYTLPGAGNKNLALAPAIFQSSAGGGEVLKGVAISLNGSDWSYMKLAEVRGICDILEHVDLVSYQLQFAMMMRTCMGEVTAAAPAIGAGAPPAPAAPRSSTVYNTQAPAAPTPVATPKIVVETKPAYQAPAAPAANPTVVPAQQKQTPVTSATDIDSLFGMD